MSNQNEGNNMKSFMGMPMRWERNKIFKNLWNPEENRIFPPKYYGIGWDLNFHAVFTKAGIIKGRKTTAEEK